MDGVDRPPTRPGAPPARRDLGRPLATALGRAPEPLESFADRFHVEATERGLARLSLGRRGRDDIPAAARRHVEQARIELAQYLAGERAFFTVALDLGDMAPFQAKVLVEASRIPFGTVESYAAIARRIRHPGAARAVGNALGANPVPIIVPCHRVIRGDGTWGHYALGGELKTRLLALERATPALVGCPATRVVCLRGCPHQQRIGTDQRVIFALLRDAESAGYRRCRACRPGTSGGRARREASG
jgi:O-6-methylguanine DNA methyltransferase